MIQMKTQFLNILHKLRSTYLSPIYEMQVQISELQLPWKKGSIIEKTGNRYNYVKAE